MLRGGVELEKVSKKAKLVPAGCVRGTGRLGCLIQQASRPSCSRLWIWCGKTPVSISASSEVIQPRLPPPPLPPGARTVLVRISVWGPCLEQAGLGAFPTGNFWLWRGLVAPAGSLGTPVPPEHVPCPKHRICEMPHFALPPETRRDFPIDLVRASGFSVWTPRGKSCLQLPGSRLQCCAEQLGAFPAPQTMAFWGDRTPWCWGCQLLAPHTALRGA